MLQNVQLTLNNGHPMLYNEKPTLGNGKHKKTNHQKPTLDNERSRTHYLKLTFNIGKTPFNN